MSGMCVWVCGHPPVCSCPQDDAERESIQQEMMDDIVSGGPAILEALSQTATAESWVQNRMQEHRNKTEVPRTHTYPNNIRAAINQHQNNKHLQI